MKKIITKWITKLGFIGKEEVYEMIQRESMRQDHSQSLEVFGLQEEINLMKSQLETILEVNHKLKKLEQYLKVDYVVKTQGTKPAEDVKFIGYIKHK